jgi:gluconolactonase
MAELREMTDGLIFPEGPVAMPDGSVVLVEIGRRCLTRVWPDGRKEIVAEPGGGPNGMAIGPDGKAYVCNNGGFEFATTEHGTRPVREAWN